MTSLPINDRPALYYHITTFKYKPMSKNLFLFLQPLGKGLKTVYTLPQETGTQITGLALMKIVKTNQTVQRYFSLFWNKIPQQFASRHPTPNPLPCISMPCVTFDFFVYFKLVKQLELFFNISPNYVSVIIFCSLMFLVFLDNQE